MLLRLSIRDFVICEEAVMEFSPGLNALTGETGAGKSILIDAIGFLSGGRGAADWIRRGSGRLVVEGSFDLGSIRRRKGGVGRGSPAVATRSSSTGETPSLLEEILQGEDLLILRREMTSDGRTRCLANGRQVLVAQLRELTRGVLWIVGQGEQRALVSPAEQEWLLDRYAGTQAARREYRRLRALFLARREDLAALAEEREAFAREEDWLRFQEREIAEVGIRPGERERLEARRAELRRREKEEGLRATVQGRLFAEEGSVLDHLESLSHLLAGAEGEPWSAVRDALLELREGARGLRRLVESTDGAGADPEDLGDADAVEERLRLLERLSRKYGGEEAVVLAHLQEVRARLERGEDLAARIDSAQRETEELRDSLGAAGSILAAARRRGAKRFAAAAGDELAGLGMSGASLSFRFGSEPDPEGVPLESGSVRPLENGLERTGLLFRSHASEAEGDLGRIASGGELSRILLAIYAALGEAGPPGCWVLDEVDQGIGGETANRVGERLSRMARRAQVLLVTHLPAIAARADRQFRVVKDEIGGRPVAQVSVLDREGRLSELARMLSGEEASGIARRHAQELLDAAGRADAH